VPISYSRFPLSSTPQQFRSRVLIGRFVVLPEVRAASISIFFLRIPLFLTKITKAAMRFYPSPSQEEVLGWVLWDGLQTSFARKDAAHTLSGCAFVENIQRCVLPFFVHCMLPPLRLFPFPPPLRAQLRSSAWRSRRVSVIVEFFFFFFFSTAIPGPGQVTSL